MIIKINLRSIVLMLALVLILMSTNAVAIAQEGTDDQTIPPVTSRQPGIEGSAEERSVTIPGGPGFISIHPSQFLPKDSGTEYTFYFIKELYVQKTDPTHANVEFLAPIDLPHFAKISQLIVYFFDDNVVDDGYNLSVSLNRCDFGSAKCSVLGTATSNGLRGYGYVMTSTFLDEPVDRQLYNYVLHLIIPGGFLDSLTLVNLRVDFNYPTYFPTVRN